MSTSKDTREEIYFNGGLDTDSDDKFVKQGDYIDAKNIIKFYNGDAGLVVNVEGNSEIENTYLPAGTNKCIGWCSDDENNAIIFFNYNSNNNHGIYRYLKSSGTFQKILHNESVLGFVSDCNNLQANVIGGMLFWNEGKDSSGDYINVPRKINIERARRHTNSLGGDAYDDITVDVMSVIKRPYLGYLNCMFSYDSSITYNSKFTTNSFYRFSLQLIYDDNERSVLGTYSNVCERLYDDDNYVAIRFKYFDVDSTVSKIRIYAIKDFIGDPFLITEIDVSDTDGVYNSIDDSEVSSLSDGNYYVYRFYGDADGRIYDGNTNIFDNVPIFANTQTISNNRLMYGNIDYTEDFGDPGDGTNVCIPIQYDVNIYDDSAFSASYSDGATEYSFSVSGIFTAIALYVNQNSTHFMHVLWEGHTAVSGSSNGYTHLYMKIDARKVSPYWNYDKIVEYIILHSEVYVVDGSGNRTDGTLSNTGSEPNFTLKGEITDDGNISGVTVTYNILRYDKANNLAYKSKSNRNFAVVFFDKYGRTLGYQVDDTITYPTYDRILRYVGAPYGPYAYINNFYSIGVPFPSNSDVDYVSIVSSGNLDYIGCWQLKDPVSVISSGSLDSLSEIGITFPKDYSFTDGDVLRIMGNDKLWKILSADDDYVYVSGYCDYEDGDSIEILRLNQSTSSLYYEIRTFDVSGGAPTYDNAYLFYLLSDGDVWLDISKGSGDSPDDYIYEKFYNNEGVSIRGIGRVFPEKETYDNTEFQHILYSNKYFENTSINGLNTFVAGNRVELSDSNGDIIDLKRVGEVLYAIQKKEITSFYLGKTILKQASTGEVTADTSQVLGGKRESAFDYGSIFPTVRMDNNIFGYDIYKGVFWMNGYNGVNIISGKDASVNYKMDTYFKDKAKDLLASGISNVQVLIGVDKPNETIYVSFIDSATPANNDTIAYHLPTNRWVSTYSFIPEKYSWMDDKFYSLKSGKLYEHNDSTVSRCNFYGTDYDSYIEFVSHSYPNLVKIFNAIAIHSDDQWTIDYITIEANDSYTNGMYTKILDSEWIKEEGVYKASMPKNMKTRSSAISNYDRYEGEDMKGYVVKVKMTNSSTNKVELFKVDLIEELSK